MNNTKNNYQISVEQILFLEREIVEYKKNPTEGSAWNEVKKRIKNKTSAPSRFRGKKA